MHRSVRIIQYLIGELLTKLLKTFPDLQKQNICDIQGIEPSFSLRIQYLIF